MAPRRPRDGDDPSNPSVYEGERDAEGRPHGTADAPGRRGGVARGPLRARRAPRASTLRFPPTSTSPGDGAGGTAATASVRRVGTRLGSRDVPMIMISPSAATAWRARSWRACCTAPRFTTPRTALAGKARTCTASSPAWSRSSTRAALWCSAAITRTAGATATASCGNRTAPSSSRTGMKARRGARGSSSTRARMACPSTRRSKIKSRRSAAGTDATRRRRRRRSSRSSPTSPTSPTGRQPRETRVLRSCSARSLRRAPRATRSRARRRSSRGTTRSGRARGELLGALVTSSKVRVPTRRKKKKARGSSRTAATISGSIGTATMFFCASGCGASRAWREPFETPDLLTIPKLEARGVLSAASPEPSIDRSWSS